jgi:hypothetical protein
MADDPRKWADGLFDILIQKGEDDFVRELKEVSFVGQEHPGAVESIGDTLRNAKQAAGTIINYEFIEASQLGTRTTRLRYVVNHVRYAILYHLTFYRTDHGWQLINFNLLGDIGSYPFD